MITQTELLIIENEDYSVTAWNFSMHNPQCQTSPCPKFFKTIHTYIHSRQAECGIRNYRFPGIGNPPPSPAAATATYITTNQSTNQAIKLPPNQPSCQSNLTTNQPTYCPTQQRKNLFSACI